MARRGFVAFALAFVFSATAAAQGTVFLVRHAERADAGKAPPPGTKADPSLSATGRARAAALADMLKDAAISAIFVTEYKRTQETAAPLAKILSLTPLTVGSGEATNLIAKVRQIAGNVLVVGHSNTVPEVIKGLGVATEVTIGDNDYDNLFIVTAGPPPRVVRLHYR